MEVDEFRSQSSVYFEGIKVKQIRGGFVGADDARRQLEVGELLDLAGFETIVWTQSSRQTKWTADAVKGQLWLRNLRRDGWSEELRAALGNAGLLHQGKIKGTASMTLFGTLARPGPAR